MTPGRDSLQGALPQPLPQQHEPSLEQRPKQSRTTAARIGLARGLQPAYVAEYDPWHENGYISNDELGLPPADHDHADQPEHEYAAPQLQPPSETMTDPDSQMQTPTMDPWNFLAREYASHGPLLPPHLWQHNPLGLHQLHQAGPLNAHNGEMVFRIHIYMRSRGCPASAGTGTRHPTCSTSSTRSGTTCREH